MVENREYEHREYDSDSTDPFVHLGYEEEVIEPPAEEENNKAFRKQNEKEEGLANAARNTDTRNTPDAVSTTVDTQDKKVSCNRVSVNVRNWNTSGMVNQVTMSTPNSKVSVIVRNPNTSDMVSTVGKNQVTTPNRINVIV